MQTGTSIALVFVRPFVAGVFIKRQHFTVFCAAMLVSQFAIGVDSRGQCRDVHAFKQRYRYSLLRGDDHICVNRVWVMW